MHTFFLSRQNVQGSMVNKDPEKASKRHLESYSIPSFSLIKDPRPNKQGTTFIANVSGETSPFVDEQSDPDIINKIKRGEVKLPKMQFTEGRRNVEEYNIVEYEYLKLCPFNELNKKNNRTRTFFEFKPNEVSKKNVENEMKDIKIKSEILSLELGRLKAIARVAGAISSAKTFDSIDPDVIKHSLIVKVGHPQGREIVEELLDNPLLEPRFDILEGIDEGLILWHPRNDNDLMWKSGGVLVNVPAGTPDKEKYAAEYLWHKGRETLNTLRNLLGRRVVTEQETTSGTNDELKDWISSASRVDIINKIMEWSKENPDVAILKLKGPYFYFGDQKLAFDESTSAKGKNGVREFLTDKKNNDLYNMVYQEWAKFVL